VLQYVRFGHLERNYYAMFRETNRLEVTN